MAATSFGGGYWLVASDGGVFAFGDAAFYGSMGGTHLNAPIIGMAATPDDRGYWLAASDGGIFAFGDAKYYGSMGGTRLAAPIVGLTARPDGRGYLEVASDGGVFAFGESIFEGSMGGQPLNAEIVGIAQAGYGEGYWLVAADGGIFSFDAPFLGSAGALPLAAPVVSIQPTSDSGGYFIFASDGGVFSYGDAHLSGSTEGRVLAAPVVGGTTIAGGVDGNLSGPTVGVVGDSITQLIAPDLAMTLDTSYAYQISGIAGDTISQQLPTIEAMVSGPTGPPQDMILNLGTNDVLSHNTLWQGAFDQEIDAVENLHCVILVTVNQIPDHNQPGIASSINAAIAQQVADHPNFHEIDWWSLLREGNNAVLWLSPYDGIHPTAAGQQELAGLYLQALQQDC
jgi:lysophospholipase L1-like esterase